MHGRTLENPELSTYIAWLNSTHGKKSENYAVILATAPVLNSGQKLKCE